MAERKSDSAEHLVDEMKRKARRRLVGAIVLALGAIIVLPLLLEKEPRPLGDDVSVQIPPVDEGKFINRLTGKAAEKALPKAESRVITAAPAASEPKTEARAEAAPARSATERSPAPPIATSEPVAPKVDSKESAPTPAPKAEAADGGAEAKPAQVASAPAEVPAAPPPAATAKAEGFVVQLAAFADDKGANALANKLKKNGYAAYVQPIETSRGTLWRVRVGGYATRPEADAARATLKGEGYNGIIAPAQ